ncbi:MAG: hypothetical protein GQ542_13800 [Desulforhopalus sp.]|nr:hypothetical protein [Desulforhopalus sp.]
MTITLSVIAIILSVTSFGFSVYQYKIGSKIKINEKINDLVKDLYSLRRTIEEKKNKYANTDDIPDYADTFEIHISVVEDVLATFLKKGKISIEDFYEIERECITLHLEFDLFCKQIDETIRFNKECVSAGMKPIEFDSYD